MGRVAYNRFVDFVGAGAGCVAGVDVAVAGDGALRWVDDD